jgi:hypothetical protein
LANLDNPGRGADSSSWFLETCHYAAGTKAVKLEKDGIPTHGYQLNGEQQLYEAHAVPVLWAKHAWGDYGRTRGELALEPTPVGGGYGNWAEAPWWSLHANMFWCLTYGVDIWNLYANFIKNETFAPTMEVFNRFAGEKDPATSPGAIISFRDGLDSADFERFPASIYGDDSRVVGNGSSGNCTTSEGPVCCRNAKRTVAIAAAYAHRGAKQEDAKIATGKSVKQKKADALNDVGCQVSGLLIDSIDSLDQVSGLLIDSIDSLDQVSGLQVQQVDPDIYNY